MESLLPLFTTQTFTLTGTQQFKGSYNLLVNVRLLIYSRHSIHTEENTFLKSSESHCFLCYFTALSYFWSQIKCPSLCRNEQTCYLHHQGNHHANGGSKYLWNDGKLQPDYTALQPRILTSSHLPPYKPQIHLVNSIYMYCNFWTKSKLLTESS